MYFLTYMTTLCSQNRWRLSRLAVGVAAAFVSGLLSSKVLSPTQPLATQQVCTCTSLQFVPADLCTTMATEQACTAVVMHAGV